MKDWNLVEVKGKSVFTTSLIISDNCKVGHETVIGHIRKHQFRFEELGQLRFEIGVKSKKGAGQKTEYAELNEDQATVLITMLRNTDIVLDFKFALVKAFRKAINELARIQKQQLTIDWQEARANGKCIRSTLSSVVQAYERLADKQGGEKGKPENRHYHSTITKMIYKELFGDSSLKNVRDSLDALKLQFLSICEQSCAEEIEKLVEIEVEYHDIYSECKKRVIATVQGLAASKLKGDNSVVKLAWDKNERN